MNKEEMIKVIQASIDGKAIESKFKDGHDWLVMDPGFNFAELDYREKKEPIERDITFCTDGTICNCTVTRMCEGARIVRMREVVE